MADARSGTPILVIENDADAPVGRLGDWLVEAGAELESAMPRPAIRCRRPDALTGYRALVVLGGGMGAQDDVRAPWLPAVRQLLATAVSIELPTLGLCLGGQLLAVAAGGQVTPAETPEYGAQLVAKRQAAAEDPLLRELPITPDVLQWHVDEISRLPPAAVLLASSPVLRGAGVPDRPAGLGDPVPPRDHAGHRRRAGPSWTPNCWPTTTCPRSSPEPARRTPTSPRPGSRWPPASSRSPGRRWLRPALGACRWRTLQPLVRPSR